MKKINSLIKTDDGSYTVIHPDFEETMHSSAGAYDEALKKHIIPSKILTRTEKEIKILDTGFGLGYNSLAAIYELLNEDANRNIKITSFEQDRFFTDAMRSIAFDDSRSAIYRTLISAYQTGKFENENYSITIIFGDAREKIRTIHETEFHAVFHDPFSPGKNPELWTVEYFKEIKKLMAHDGILTTYSSAPQIRRGLLEAGFSTATAPSTGKKREGTIAAPTEFFFPETLIDREKLFSEPRSEPYHDRKFSLNREEILSERSKRVKTARKNT